MAQPSKRYTLQYEAALYCTVHVGKCCVYRILWSSQVAKQHKEKDGWGARYAPQLGRMLAQNAGFVPTCRITMRYSSR